MSLSLETNPVGSDDSKIFAGFQPCEFIFKREDLAIISVTSGVGTKAKINHSGGVLSGISAGDYVYLYSEGATNYIYDGSFEVITNVSNELTVDTPYIETGGVGYVNYLKNYYVELQCVHPDWEDANLLPFSLESDGDAAGNIVIDVSVMNELNQQRADISEGHLSEGVQEFEVKYRQVYDSSSESFTLIDNKLLIMLFSIDVPEEEEVLNQFDLPKLFLGYKGALVTALQEYAASSTIELLYNELDVNNNVIASGSLGILDADVNGFIIWEWPSDISLETNTKYVEFVVDIVGIYDFADTDFESTDFVTS